MQPTAIGVVIPIFAQPRLATEAVLSALSQDVDASVGIVVVNDGCDLAETDETCRLIRAVFPDRVLYAHAAHRGPAAARNVGIAVALRSWPSVEALYFLDADDRLLPYALRRLHAALTGTGAGWAFTDMVGIGDRARIYGTAGDHLVLEHFVRNYVSAGSMVSRRVFDAGLRFDESMTLGLEDWDFWLQLSAAGFRGVYVPGAGLLYRRRGESVTARSNRSRAEVLGRLYRSRASWVNPTTAVELEQVEAPRYAIDADGHSPVIVATDPRRLTTAVERHDFLAKAAWGLAHGRLSRVPPYLVAADRHALAWLGSAGLLPGVLWHMELLAATGGTAALAVQPDRVLSVRLADHRLDEPFLMAMLPTTAALCRPSMPAEHPPLMPPVDVGPIPAAIGQDALRVLNTLVADLEQCARDTASTPGSLMVNDNWRTKNSLMVHVNRLFGTSALLPVTANPARRAAFVSAAPWDAVTRLRLAAVATAFQSAGWTRHLVYVQRPGADVNWPFARGLFDTITGVAAARILPFDRSTSLPHLLGLLATSSVIVNHGCAELLPVHAELRRFGARSIYWHAAGGVTAIDEALAAVSYGDAIDLYLADEPAARSTLLAHGVPAARIVDDCAALFATARPTTGITTSTRDGTESTQWDDTVSPPEISIGNVPGSSSRMA